NGFNREVPMGSASRSWIAPVLIALTSVASVVVAGGLQPLVDVQWAQLLPLATRAASRPMPRGLVAFGLPALALIVWLMFRMFSSSAGARIGQALFADAPTRVTSAAQFERFSKAYDAVVLAVVGMILGLQAAILAAALQHPLLAARVVGIGVGVSLAMMGNVM